MTWTADANDQHDSARIAALELALADLQRRVAALEATRPEPAPIEDAVSDPWSVPPWPEIVQLIRSGKKIEAIKVHREHFRTGLKESKEIVEEAERRLP